MRFRSCLILAVLIAATVGKTAAQNQISGIRVYADPAGPQFYVDGQQYMGPATFFWPAGSKHTLSLEPLQVDIIGKTQYAFNSWSDSTGLLNWSQPTLVVTADPAITFIRANFTVQYALTLAFFNCKDNDPVVCGSPGNVYVNGTPFFKSTQVYLAAGTRIDLMAIPNPGWIFLGWGQGLGNAVQAFLNSFVLSHPTSVYPLFARAGQMTIYTSPDDLYVLADRTSVGSGTTLDWGLGTTHTLSVTSPQVDSHGVTWIFDSWSDGGAPVHAFTMPADNPRQTITARFIQPGRVGFFTDPPGLKLQIDGRDNWQNYNFAWSPGETHTVSAPLQQSDSKNRLFTFNSWSNGGPVTQQVTVTQDMVTNGLRLTAKYDPLSRISIQSFPPGVTFQVDGNPCQTPCTIDRPLGTAVHIVAPDSAPLRDGAKLQFNGWDDVIPPDRTVLATEDLRTYSARYKLRYQLKTSSDPPDGVTWRIDPSSADGFYDAQTLVAVAVDLRPGYRFRNWEGDLSGSFPSGLLNMTAPRNVRAVLDPVPYVPSDGIRNAAAPTLQDGVAPGSIASIMGVNLASDTQTGPQSPLAQSIAGVTVEVAGRLLPLYFVSPGQINVQIPSDLPEGPQTLIVHSTGKPDAKATFVIQRNAPGLFNIVAGGQAFAVASHEDGSPVSLDDPARHGELVSVLGTGLGPFDPAPLDGFAVPTSPTYSLIDPITLSLGGVNIDSITATALPGFIGLTTIQFRISDDAPAAASAELKIAVNGQESNTVLLPIQ